MRYRLLFILTVGLLILPAVSAAAETPLEAPRNFRAQAIENLERVDLNWEAPTAASVGYRIYRSASKGSKGGILVDSRAGLNYTDTTVVYGATYYYTLAAFLDAKTESTTPALAVTPALAAPGNVQAVNTEQGGEIKLIWQRPTLGLLLTFNIYRSTDDKSLGSQIVRAQAGEEYLDRTAENGRQYFYRLKAVAANGHEGTASQLAIGAASDKKPPLPPTLNGSFASPDKASLSWGAPLNERNLNYILYRSATLGANGDRVIETKNTSYVQIGLPAGAVYYYGITASDAAGNVSELSQQVKITMAPKSSTSPAASTLKAINLTAEGTSQAGEILLRWKLPADSRVAYSRVYRRQSVNGDAGQIANKVAGPTYLDKTVLAGQRYYYTVRLVGKDGIEYQPSEQVNAVAFDPANRSQGTVPPSGRPVNSRAPSSPVPAKPAPSPSQAKAYAYGKTRLADLRLEAALANDLYRALVKELGVKKVPRRLNPVLARAYIYGGYGVKEIARTISHGPGLVHPTVPAVVWRKTAEYKKNK